MLFAIDPSDPRPIYLQIVAQVKQQVSQALLKPGDELPGVRELADSLQINLHTVHHAYKQLRDDGVIHLRLGRRARVAPLREQPAGRELVESVLVKRLDELITEAFHLRLSEEDFRALVDELLAKRKEKQS